VRTRLEKENKIPTYNGSGTFSEKADRRGGTHERFWRVLLVFRCFGQIEVSGKVCKMVEDLYIREQYSSLGQQVGALKRFVAAM
jgi:hypothetical protein